MAVLYTNNAASILSASITNTAASFSVASGQGALFPAISGGDYFYVTLLDSAGNIEIVKVTARSADTLTITRAQDGTSARAWSAGDKVELRITKAMLDDFKTDTGSGYLPLSGGTLSSTVDGILTLNKSSGTAWNYINFSVAGTRRFYFGLNASYEPELGVDNGATFRVNGAMTVGGNTVLHAGNYTDYAAAAGHTHSYLPLSGGTLTASLSINGSLSIGSSGTYGAGSIYSDSNWGMLFRARQASPVAAQYRWADSDDVELLRINNDKNLISQGNNVLTAGNYTNYAAPASHSHSYLPLAGGTMTGNINFNSYDFPNALTVGSGDPNWAFGSSSNGSSVYFMQAKFHSGGGSDWNRGFRVLDARTGVVVFQASDIGSKISGNLGLGCTPDIRLSVNGEAHISSYLYMGGTAGSYSSWGSRDYTTSGNRYINANYFEVNNYGYGSSWSLAVDGASTRYNGNVILHAGNYTNYVNSGTHDHSRIAWVGTRTAESGAAYNTPSGYLEVVGSYNNGWPNQYGNVLSVNGGGAGQLFMGWIGGSGAETGELYYRSMTDWRTNWGSWRRVLTNANWSEYAAPISHTHNYVSKTGDTMTGRLTIDGSGWTTSNRNYSNEWIEFGNYSGLYSPLNSAHFYPNNGTYGSWRVAGSRNGWGGIEFDSTNGNVVLMLGQDSNTTGFHNNNYGWQFRWSSGELHVYKNSYGGGTDATVLDSSNYSNYAATASHNHENIQYFDAPGSAGTYVWVRAVMGGFNSGGETVRFSVQRSISDNGGSPYGGPSADFTVHSREWHGGQECATVYYSEHGAGSNTGGLYISHAGPRDLAGGGYWFYMRIEGGIRYIIRRYNNSGPMGNFETTAASDPGNVSAIQGWGFSLLGINAYNFYGNGATLSSKLYVGGATVNSGYNGVFASNMVGAASGNKLIYLYNDGSTIKLDAYDYGASSALNFQIGGNGGTVNVSGVLNVSADNVALALTGPQSRISFKDAASAWTGYVGYVGNTGTIDFSGRNVEVYSGWNGTISLINGSSGYNSGTVAIPYGNLTVQGNTALHAGNYGSYALPLSGGTMTGVLVTKVAGGWGTYDSAFSVRGDASNPAIISFHRPGYFATNLGLDTDGVIKIGGWSNGGPWPILHSGNYSSCALPISGGTLTGGRPITLNTSNGWVYAKGDSGGWAMGHGFYGSSDTFRGGFGATGGGNDLSYFFVGADYNNASMTWSYSDINAIKPITLGGRSDSSTFGGNTSGMSGNAFVAEVRASGNKPTLTFHYENIATTHIEHLSDGSLNVWRPSNEGTSVFKVGGNVALHAGNYTSYSPSLTGSGASGTWGISITGNAASAYGLTYAQLFNNVGNSHGTRTDFNNVPDFGVHYVQGNGNGPGTCNQYYGFTLGLGNEYAYSQYAMQFAIPRLPTGGWSQPYLAFRFRESGSWGSWYKAAAGYADTAGSVSGGLTTSNYTDYVVPKSGGTMSGNLGFSQPVGLTFANGQYIKDNGGGGLAIYSGAAINLTGTYLTYNGNTILTGANIGSYALALSGGTMTGAFAISNSNGRIRLVDSEDGINPRYDKTGIQLNKDGNSIYVSTSVTYHPALTTWAPTGSQIMVFRQWSTNSEFGNISINGSGVTQYNTTSDYRLKTDVVAVSGSGERLDALKPVEYTWAANGHRARGFLAHEFQQVYESSVTGEKDAVDAEGRPKYQAMQAGSAEVIAGLVSEVQSLRTRMAEQESIIQELLAWKASLA